MLVSGVSNNIASVYINHQHQQSQKAVAEQGESAAEERIESAAAERAEQAQNASYGKIDRYA